MGKVNILGFATAVVVVSVGGANAVLSGGRISSDKCSASLSAPFTGGLGISLSPFFAWFTCNKSNDETTSICEFEDGDSVEVTHWGLLFTWTKVSWSLKDCYGSVSFPNFGTVGVVRMKWTVKTL